MNCKINNRRGTTPRHPTLGARNPTPAAGQCGVPHAKRKTNQALGYPTLPTFRMTRCYQANALRSVGHYPTPPHAPRAA